LKAADFEPRQCACGRLFRLGDPEALIDLRTFQLLDGAGRPPDLYALDPGLGAQTEMHAPAARRCVTHRGGHMVVLHLAGSGGHTDHGTDRIAVAPVACEQCLEPMLPRAGYVPQQFGRFVEAGDHDVHSPVIVKIAERAATMRRRLRRPGSSGGAGIHKTSTPGVGKTELGWR